MYAKMNGSTALQLYISIQKFPLSNEPEKHKTCSPNAKYEGREDRIKSLESRRETDGRKQRAEKKDRWKKTPVSM